MPSRMAARSTTAGTPVKSCSSTRAGVKAISFCRFDATSQLASASMSSAIDEPLVLAPQQVLEQDFQRIREPGDPGETRPFERRKAEDPERVSAGGQLGAGC